MSHLVAPLDLLLVPSEQEGDLLKMNGWVTPKHHSQNNVCSTEVSKANICDDDLSFQTCNENNLQQKNDSSSSFSLNEVDVSKNRADLKVQVEGLHGNDYFRTVYSNTAQVDVSGDCLSVSSTDSDSKKSNKSQHSKFTSDSSNILKDFDEYHNNFDIFVDGSPEAVSFSDINIKHFETTDFYDMSNNVESHDSPSKPLPVLIPSEVHSNPKIIHSIGIGKL